METWGATLINPQAGQDEECWPHGVAGPRCGLFAWVEVEYGWFEQQNVSARLDVRISGAWARTPPKPTCATRRRSRHCRAQAAGASYNCEPLLRREVSRDLEALLNSIALESVSTRQGLPGPQVDPELWYSRVTRRTIDEIGVNDILKSQNSYHYLRPRLASLHRTR